MSNSKFFLNTTDLDDKQAMDMVTTFRDLVIRGEKNRLQRMDDDDVNNRFWRGEIWTQEQKNEFAKLDIVPYEFGVQRTLINNLISRQRNRRFSFDVVPKDVNSYERHRQGREQFVQDNIDDFETIEQAEEYYDRYADDEYAQAVTAVLENSRYESKAKHVESTTFQQGLISGLDFLKCIYSDRYNREGGIEITRRPQRAIFYDENSVQYDLSDIEYIGETHLLYKDQLIQQYPDFSQQIEELYEEYSKFKQSTIAKINKNWKHFYNYEQFHGDDGKVRVAELWYLDTEERFTVYDNINNYERIVDFDTEEEEIYENLKEKVLLEMYEEAQQDPMLAEQLQQDDIEDQITQIVEERFEIGTTKEPIWYKAVFSYNALFEWERSPLPHGCHPYYPFFAHFSEGFFHGLMDDIRDVVVAINKALSFREVMMAHGSKGLVVVDRDALMKSGYDIDEIAEHWSSVGSALALKLKPGQRVRDIIDSITTIGEGLDAINFVLQDLDNRLYQISGVNLAQLGVVERETTASGYRQQLAEGEANNGLIYDNFVRTLEGFYNDKVVPLVTTFIKERKQSVIRMIGEEHRPWLDFTIDENFDLFEEAVRKGQYNTVLTPTEDNAQRGAERAAQYLELAMAGMLDLEVALEFSDDPNRYKIIKRNREKQQERFRRETAMQAEIPMIQEMMLEQGFSPQHTAEFIQNLQKERMLQMSQQGGQTGQQVQRGQGAGDIQSAASESQRLQQIERQ